MAGPRRQRGAMLLLLLAVLALGGSWWLVRAVATPVNRTPLERSHNERVLQQAKAALIGYIAATAANYDEDYPGRLPCPEPAAHYGNIPYEGIAAPYLPSGAATCTNVGRLPWRTLGIDKLTDATGEPLWYAVSIGASGWARSSSGTQLSINANKPGDLSVNGQPNVAVAAIIAPGRPLNLAPNASQTAAGCATRLQRRGASPPDPLDYLECHNLGANSLRLSVVDNVARPVSNDQMVFVTAAEVMAAIEGIIARRIEDQVAPQLKSIYASAEWGASAANPIFPFAVPFGDTSLLPTSEFKGALGQKQGWLPVTARTCNADTAGRCDADFVQWSGATTVTRIGGNADGWSYDGCAASTATEIRCDVSFWRLCLLPVLIQCDATLSVRVRRTALNVAMAMRTLSTAGISNLSSPSMAAPIGPAGGALGLVQGSLPTASCMPVFILGIFVCTASGTYTVTIPIAVFADHPMLDPPQTADWYWFMANKWYEVTYYAVAPSHLASGAVHDCVAAGDCLTVTGGTPSSDVRATLVLAGRSLAGATRPNAILTDFLDTAQNQDLDEDFEQNRHDRSFNDRFVALNP